MNAFAFASSLAVLTAAVYLVLSLLAIVSPATFQVVFNAQFFGADVASLLPRVVPDGGFVRTFIILVVTAWLFGYVWAWLYNLLARAFGGSRP